MSKLIDISGKRFGKLVVTRRAGVDTTGKTTWEAVCDCGCSTIVVGLNLKTGTTKSCGCLRRRKGVDNPKYLELPKDALRVRKRVGAAFRKWRTSVLRRCPVCVRCGEDEKLHAHHIRGASEFPNTMFDVQTGVTLCAKCHTEFHVKFGRRKGFTEENLEFFVDFPIVWLVTRHKVRGGIADLEKAKHYIELLIELETRNAHLKAQEGADTSRP